MNDAELKALTELVATDRFVMEADNAQRASNGYAMAWAGDIKWEARDKLEAELKRRKILSSKEIKP